MSVHFESRDRLQMNLSPPLAATAVKKRRSYNSEDEHQVKRFAEDLRAADPDISWVKLMRNIKENLDVGPTVAHRMLQRGPSSPERHPIGRPRMMTAKAVNHPETLALYICAEIAWGFSLKRRSALKRNLR